MSQVLRDDALYRTRQAWIRTGLGAGAVAALAIRAAVVGQVDGAALACAVMGAGVVIGVGVSRGRRARSGADVQRAEAWLVASAIVLLGASGVWLAIAAS